MSLLSDKPLDWTNNKLMTLRDNLAVAYWDRAKARQLVISTGIKAASYPDNLATMILTWTSVMDVLVEQAKLRTLLLRVLEDGTTAGYHAYFTEILAEDSKERPKGLSVDEQKLLRGTYIVTFQTIPAFQELLVSGLQRSADDFSDADLKARIDALIKYYDDHGIISDLFAAPFKIASRENDYLMEIAKLQIENVRKAYEQRMAEPWVSDPYERCFLNGDIPFVNRRVFRDLTRQLSQKGAKRFLLVNGEPGVGKTHSRWFLNLIAEQGIFEVCYIELKNEAERVSYYPDTFALRVDSDLKLPAHPDNPKIPEQHEVAQKWAELVGEWLIKKLKLNGTQCWIALDGFAHADLPEPTKQLFNLLVSAVYERLPQVRLLLLDYPPEYLDEDILDDMVQEEYIDVVSQVELERFLKKTLEELQLHKAATVNDQKLQHKAVEIMGSLVGKPPEKHMREIKRMVSNAPYELIQD